MNSVLSCVNSNHCNRYRAEYKGCCGKGARPDGTLQPSSAPTTLQQVKGASDLEAIQAPLGRLPPFPDGGDHQSRAADHVATGEDLRVAGLELVSGLFRSDDPALTVY